MEDVMRDSEVESDHGDGDMEGYDGEIDEDVVSLVSEESYHSVHSNPSIEVDGSNPFEVDGSNPSVVGPSIEVDGSNPSIEVDGSNPSAVDPSTILDSHDASDGSDDSLDLEDDVDTEQARQSSREAFQGLRRSRRVCLPPKKFESYEVQYSGKRPGSRVRTKKK